MTGAHSGGPTGRRSSRSLAWRVATPVVALLSGSLFAISAANSDGADLRPGRYTDLAGLVEGERADYQKVEDRLGELSDEVDRRSGAVDDKGVDRVRRRVAELRDPAGLTPRSGPGLSITLSDSPDDVFDAARERNKELPEDQRINLNRFVVHQQDIQAVVNALWRAGASAITIAGQRVISTTGIKCEGNAVQLEGVPYPQPYVIRAVGDPDQLAAGVLDDQIVSDYRDDADEPLIDIGWDLAYEDRVQAPAYDGVLDLQYARPLSRVR